MNHFLLPAVMFAIKLISVWSFYKHFQHILYSIWLSYWPQSRLVRMSAELCPFCCPFECQTRTAADTDILMGVMWTTCWDLFLFSLYFLAEPLQICWHFKLALIESIRPEIWFLFFVSMYCFTSGHFGKSIRRSISQPSGWVGAWKRSLQVTRTNGRKSVCGNSYAYGPWFKPN